MENVSLMLENVFLIMEKLLESVFFAHTGECVFREDGKCVCKREGTRTCVCVRACEWDKKVKLLILECTRFCVVCDIKTETEAGREFSCTYTYFTYIHTHMSHTSWRYKEH